jgi:hypothetical protein
LPPNIAPIDKIAMRIPKATFLLPTRNQSRKNATPAPMRIQAYVAVKRISRIGRSGAAEPRVAGEALV